MKERNDIPGTWTRAPVGELFQVVGGGTPSTADSAFWAGQIPWITSANIDSGGRISNVKHISEGAVESSATNVVRAGSVIVVTRVGLGKVALAPFDVCFSQDCQALLFDPEHFDPEFVAHQMRWLAAGLIPEAQGTTISGVAKNRLLSLKFSVPPRREQSRVVQEVEAQFSRLDSGIEALRRVQRNLSRYRAAALQAALVGDSRRLGSAQTEWKPLRSVIASLDQGWSPRCEKHASPSAETWAVMKTTAVQALSFEPAENKQLPTALSPRTHLQIAENDVLVTRAGPRGRVGVACVIKATREKLLLSDKVYRIRVNPALMRPGFLSLVLNAPAMVEALNDIKTGISDSGVNLTQGRFLELTIPVPELSVQKRTEEALERTVSVIQNLELSVDAEIVRAHCLRRAILKRAFEGKLVPQDPNDEPASALLERIRASRAEQKSSKAKRARRIAGAAAD